MKTQKRIAAILAALVITLSSVMSLAQQPLDRTKVPAPGKSPELRVPTWTKQQLVIGATLIVSERHGLPLVSFSITFLGGANQFEPANRRGFAAAAAPGRAAASAASPVIAWPRAQKCSGRNSASSRPDSR